MVYSLFTTGAGRILYIAIVGRRASGRDISAAAAAGLLLIKFPTHAIPKVVQRSQLVNRQS